MSRLVSYLHPLLLGLFPGLWVLAVWMAGTAHAQMAEEPPPAPVVVVEAQERLLAPTTWFPGTVISRNDARLAAEVAGRLVWVAEVGTVVATSETVARLDDTLIRQDLLERQAMVAREQARLTYFSQEVKRLQELARQNITTQSLLDEAFSNREVARSELAAAQARVQQIKERLERTAVHAPFAGVVTERLRQAGEWVDSGDAIVRLVDTQSLEAQTWVPVTALAYIQPGTELTLQASPQQISGEVRTIVPVGDERSRLYELRLTLSDSPWPVGRMLRVAVPTATPRETVAVPRDALVLRRDGSYVFRILEDGTAERIAVTTGIAAGSFIEVEGGIHPGDQVVIRGGERLRPGQKVNIVTLEVES